MDEAKLPMTGEINVEKLRERAAAESGSYVRIFEPGSIEYAMAAHEFALAHALDDEEPVEIDLAEFEVMPDGSVRVVE